MSTTLFPGRSEAVEWSRNKGECGAVPGGHLHLKRQNPHRFLGNGPLRLWSPQRRCQSWSRTLIARTIPGMHAETHGPEEGPQSKVNVQRHHAKQLDQLPSANLVPRC